MNCTSVQPVYRKVSQIVSILVKVNRGMRIRVIFTVSMVGTKLRLFFVLKGTEGRRIEQNCASIKALVIFLAKKEGPGWMHL